MAIKVGGTSIIDDNKNISNVGIVTIGESTSGKLNVGSGVTATGDGTISIAGTFYAFDVVTSLKIDSFSPDDGQTGVSADTDIRITFNNPIGIGSTGYVYINSPNGNVYTYGVGSTYISRADRNRTLIITPSSSLAKGVVGAPNTITTVVDASVIDDPEFTGINTTGSNVTYSFEIETVAYGEAYEGGYFICAAGGTQWIVAPSSTEVSRNWHSRNDAVTTANANAACGDWFVPSYAQIQNPGYTCRTYWDSYPNNWNWTDTAYTGNSAWVMNITNGSATSSNMGCTWCVRAFRCVTY